TRLLVIRAGRCTLAHDQLARVVTELVANEASRGRLLLDQSLLDAWVKIEQKAALYETDAADEAALIMGGGLRRQIASNRETLLFEDSRRAWWAAAERLRTHRLKVAIAWSLTIAAVIALAVVLGVLEFSRRREAATIASIGTPPDPAKLIG